MTKIAILDDYIGVALEYGDWTVLPDEAEITVYRQAIPPERLVAELSEYEIVVITQQRARFPRAVLEGLPNLKLIVCNGRTSNVVDHEARIERGILLCGNAGTRRRGACPRRQRWRGRSSSLWRSGPALRTGWSVPVAGRLASPSHSRGRPWACSARATLAARWSRSPGRLAWTSSRGAR